MDWSVGTLLPLAVLVAVAILLPRGLLRLFPQRLWAVAAVLGLSALLLYAFGALLLAGDWLWRAPAIRGEIAADPAGALRWLAGLGLLPAIVWAPILALVSLGQAQRIAATGPADAG